MSEMVERVARIMCNAAGRSWNDEEERQYWAWKARSVILSMRSPTRDMIDRAINNGDYNDGGTYLPALSEIGWQAMIDEALK